MDDSWSQDETQPSGLFRTDAPLEAPLQHLSPRPPSTPDIDDDLLDLLEPSPPPNAHEPSGAASPAATATAPTAAATPSHPPPPTASAAATQQPPAADTASRRRPMAKAGHYMRSEPATGGVAVDIPGVGEYFLRLRDEAEVERRAQRARACVYVQWPARREGLWVLGWLDEAENAVKGSKGHARRISTPIAVAEP